MEFAEAKWVDWDQARHEGFVLQVAKSSCVPQVFISINYISGVIFLVITENENLAYIVDETPSKLGPSHLST